MNNPRVVIMGVSGSGKSTVGRLLSECLELPYQDGDDLHPRANIAKMAAGHALDDADRWPWLELVRQWLSECPTGGIIGCSALKRAYRNFIRSVVPGAVFIHVHGTRELLRERMHERAGHFMPVSLLDSQLATLEPLGDDEAGVRVDVAAPPDVVARTAARWVATGEAPIN